jgi:mttA/Hcf106 family.
MRIGTTEIILIIVLARWLFSAAVACRRGQALGKSIREFKNEVKGEEKEDKINQPTVRKKHD